MQENRLEQKEYKHIPAFWKLMEGWNPKSKISILAHNTVWRAYIELKKACFYLYISKKREILDAKEGGSKRVLKVRTPRSGKHYALYLMHATAFRKRGLGHQWMENTKSNRLFYVSEFKDYTNRERLKTISNNPYFAIGMQPWIDYDPQVSMLFSNISAYKDEIIKEAENNPDFQNELIAFLKHILLIFESSGILPDLFNDTHPNVGMGC